VKKKVFALIMVLATVLVFGLGTAMAQDAILFPYWISGGGYATFTETCQHYDDEGRTTENDILLYEVTKQFYEGTSNEQLLPGDTTSKSVTLSSSPKWGYLVVNQNPDNFDTGLEGTLFGQEYVVDLSTGTIFALNAINDPDEYDSDFYFQTNTDDNRYLSWLPETYASTMWYFFPVVDGIDLTLTNGIVWDITLQIGYNVEGVYDNNESLKSGTKYLMVGCWDTTMNNGVALDPGSGPVTANFFYALQDILTGEQYAAVANTGGWVDTYFAPIEYAGYGLAYKLQSTQILGHAMNTILFEPGEPGNSYTK
jgi:hypothetical protein